MESDGDGEPIDIVKHQKLIADVQTIGNESKQKYKFQRNEIALQPSEFGLPSAKGHLSLKDLIGDSSKLGLKKAVKRIEKRKHKPSGALEPVLHKPEEEKQTRIVNYEKVKDDLHKWDNVVWENRVAPNLQFPIEKPSMKVPSLKEYAQEFHPVTDFESEVMALPGNGGQDLTQIKSSRKESMEMRKRALEEIRQRRSELIKQRMKVLYEARKNKHRNKIKSRRFHQVLRKQKAAILKKAEENATPEEAAEMLAEKLADLERKRIEERASLRHRAGGSKFADKQKLMARFDSSARQAVENMADIGKALTEKRAVVVDDEPMSDSSESDQETEVVQTEKPGQNAMNPWFIGQTATVSNTNENDKVSVVKSHDAKDQYKKLKAVAPAAEMDEVEFHEKEQQPEAIEEVELSSSGKPKPQTISEAIGLNIKNDQPVLQPSLLSENPSNPTDNRLDVAAAFAEDDVVAEFMSEKERLANKEQPKDINLSLPGWGGWTGPGVSAKAQERRKKKFQIKAEPLKRKDSDLAHVIIKEAPQKANDALSKHQPKAIPFPFTSARDYERSMRQPLGREWVPEMSRRDLIKPRVETRIGAIIEPMDSDGKSVSKKLEEAKIEIAAEKALKEEQAKMKKNSLRKRSKKQKAVAKKTK